MMRILGYIWATPLTLIGFALSLAYWPRSWRVRAGALEAIAENTMIGAPDAQTHGWLIYYRSDAMRNDRMLQIHELTHVAQGKRWGVFFGIAYAAEFFYLWASRRAGWRDAYRNISWEIAARENAKRLS